MALVYPVYLDTPMMTAFLASLEGGIMEEANIEGKSGDTKEKSGKASLSSKVSGLLSSILSIEGGGEISKKVSESLESQYKGTIRFPNAALFIRLRDLLLEQKLVKKIDAKTKFENIAIGDILEFQGTAKPTPNYQIRRAFGQLLPLFEPYQKMSETQLEQQQVLLKNAKPNKPLKIGGEEITFQDQNHLTNARELLKYQQQNIQNEMVVFQQIGKVLDSLFPEDSTGRLLFKSDSLQVICRVYSAFARNERIQDVYDADWHCLGKVIGIVKDSEKYDLFRGLPIGYLAKNTFSNLASSLNNEDLNIEVSEPIVHGPALIMAVLAIFA